MATTKTMGTSQVPTFLGVELDTIKKQARLPENKLNKCLSQIDEFLRRTKVTLQEIQSLCGLLNFACQVVVPGRAFLHRLFELTYGLKKAHHRIKLDRGCNDDLQAWKTFLEQFNGKYFFIDETWV
jgi:hypothetical protein